MALHLSENGCYGIKINPKEPGQEIAEEHLRSVLAEFGYIKELQMPNKFLAFAFYVEYEEARNCLDSLQTSGDYLVKPGWPKQTTADEKSARNNGKSATRDESKGAGFRSKDNEEETQQQEQESSTARQKPRSECDENNATSPEENKNKINARVKFDLKKRNQESPNNGKKEGNKKTDPSSADQESQKITERNGKIDTYKNYKAQQAESPKINGENKETDNKSAITKEEGRFERQERTPRRPYRSEHPRRFRSRSECRKENRNAATNNDDTQKIKYTRGRSVDRTHYNFRFKKDADFKKTNFSFKKEHDQKNKEDKFSHQKSDYKNKRNSYHNRDGHGVSTEEKGSNKNTLTDKKKDSVKQCMLVSAVDAWTADMIKFHKRTKRASYVVVFNLPVTINAGVIYDLAKTWVEVIHVEVKYGTNIYMPPHAFVYTGSRQQSDLLKGILNKKTLKHKTLLVRTQKDLEEE